ncbi:PGDYG domain-containing protein [Trinickia sp. Y13]|uniref:PGDYG domain-containing protein n=1 Tax=Trinickia sp. Y13 TaxID=2917807 RepID=UPI00240532F4|nr:PGDYG domain-containing protein [Trinickia sp. Y13]MDG0023175.1 PGDYG domain-containing protein [Trinickia sp. Y13]
MIELNDIDLRDDPAAGRYVKDEIVAVEFASASGELMSLEGANRYEPGDALITGTGAARWVVERSRFDAKYVPAETALAHGAPGRYRNRPAVVLAKRMDAPFSIPRRAAGDVLNGAAGDWVLQYAPGDYGVVRADRFAQVYRAAEPH